MYREIDGILTYAIVYVISMLANMVLAIWLCRRRGVSIAAGIALGISYAFAMNTGARFMYDILHHRVDFLNYIDPGYYMRPGMWGGPFVYLVIAMTGVFLLARDKKEMSDVVTLTLPVPMILAKVACFLNGCCYGAPCDLPWAITFPNGADFYTAPPGIARHPTQLYEITVLVIIQIVFFVLDRMRWKGTLILWFVLFYGISRPLTELLRASVKRTPIVGPFTVTQIMFLAAALVAGVALVIVAKRRKTRQSATLEDNCHPGNEL